MRLIERVKVMQRQARHWRREGVRVGLVPTMGYLHAGHMSLVRRARGLVGPAGKVVVSIYVNPTQFGPQEDFSRYPRDLAGDLRLCRGAGVDAVFAPEDGEMYARGESVPASTWVVEEALSAGMEGASRPTHFRGVATVVAKLFNLVLPEVAVFGAKDYQQAAIIRRLARDLNFPLRVVVAPTCRERDGLAMSSRNRYLEGDLRQQALVLWRSIGRARATVRRSGRPVPATGLKRLVRRIVSQARAARLDYVEFFDPETLLRTAKVGRGTQMALAVLVGKTRLIDNGRL
jgi:pantoate--beta-alanine ligase